MSGKEKENMPGSGRYLKFILRFTIKRELSSFAPLFWNLLTLILETLTGQVIDMD
jgi:hypothetical protein